LRIAGLRFCRIQRSSSHSVDTPVVVGRPYPPEGIIRSNPPEQSCGGAVTPNARSPNLIISLAHLGLATPDLARMRQDGGKRHGALPRLPSSVRRSCVVPGARKQAHPMVVRQINQTGCYLGFGVVILRQSAAQAGIFL